MNAHSAHAFTQGVLRAAYSGATVYDGPTRFMDAVCAKLCIGGDAGPTNALKLLWRVQAGYPVDDVDSLYKELVIDEPRTFELARKAVATFTECEEVWQEIDLARRKIDTLDGIEEWHGQLINANDQISIIESLGKKREHDEDPVDLGTIDDETPFALWAHQTCAELLEKEHGHLSSQIEGDERDKAAIEAERADIAREEARIAALIAEHGGGRLEVIDNEIEGARAWLAERSIQRSQYEALASAFDEQLPHGPDGFASLLERLHARSDEAQSQRAATEGKRNAFIAQEANTRAELDEARDNLEYYLEHRVNITPAMAQARKVASTASGTPESELPFAAELMDMADGEERWRDAANIALRGLANSMLVDKRELEHFSRAIDPKRREMGMRLNFVGVDLARTYDSAPTSGCMSEKIVYKEDSPFANWVKSQVNDERGDCLCVESPELLGGRQAKITPSGQTRRGVRGAHGHGKNFRIIGFTNDRLIQELRERIAELEVQRRRLDAAKRAAEADIKHIDDIVSAVARFEELDWKRIDVDQAQRELDGLIEERKRLDSDSVLADLRRKRDEVAIRRDEKAQQLGVVKNSLEKAHAALDKANVLLENARSRCGKLAKRGVTIPPEAGTWLVELAADTIGMYGENVTEERLADFLKRSRRLVLLRRNTALETAKQSHERLERAFQTFNREFQESDPNFSTDPLDGYEDYLGILNDLLEKRLNEPEEAWTARLLRQTAQALVPLQESFSSEVRTIKERLEPINEVMARYPFGSRNGVLAIVVEDRGNVTISDFKRDLAKWSAYAFAEEAPQNFARTHAQLVRFMAKIKGDLDSGVYLDVRKLIDIKVIASWPDDPERENRLFTKLGEKSGGETQELVAFILGGALLYYLGDNGDGPPSYSTVFLDEAFIKADAKFTRRAIDALRGLGFQVIIAIPEDKVESISPIADTFVCVTKGDDDRSRITVLNKVASR